MLRAIFLIIGLLVATAASAQTMTLSTSNTDYQITNTFSDVDIFNVVIEINAPLAPGVFINPTITNVTYQVMGTLVAGTPSGFPEFDLQRTITGADFYAQGSSLRFEISQNAVLFDGIQAAELVPDGNGDILTFDGREEDTGRFHPAQLILNSNGTGRIQNSENTPTLNPLVEVMFGEEYITDLVFDPGNTTLLTEPSPPGAIGGGGSSALSPFTCIVLFGIGLIVRRQRRISAAHPDSVATG